MSNVKEIIEGRIEAKRYKGRPGTGMLDDLVMVSYGDTKWRPENREPVAVHVSSRMPMVK